MWGQNALHFAAANSQGANAPEIVQLLMQAMGGRVSVEDAPGGGADFGLHLPPWNPGQPGGQLSEAGQP
jgi:hypothetical protein